MKKKNLKRLQTLSKEILESERNDKESEHRDDVAVELALLVVELKEKLDKTK